MWSIHQSSESSMKSHRKLDCSEYPEISRMSVNGSCWQPVLTKGRADPYRMGNRETQRQTKAHFEPLLYSHKHEGFCLSPGSPHTFLFYMLAAHTASSWRPLSMYFSLEQRWGNNPKPRTMLFCLWHLLAWRNNSLFHYLFFAVFTGLKSRHRSFTNIMDFGSPKSLL